MTGPFSSDRIVAWGDELRRVHVQLRRALALAREAVEDGTVPEESTAPEGGPAAARELLLFCHGFCVALSGHHRAEDGALFPQVVAAHPELAPVVAKLTQDHSMIEYLIGGLGAALARGAPAEETLRHLDGIEAVMETHFGYEERQLVAVLDASQDWGATGASSLEGDRRRLFGPLA
ncbi:hemerythrin domain-containing protein [Sanguibacter sp. 25GB23B1]|uniref:hemerythrin domain-containing protein n=1 Tax=unclassified Sanguibacter TaxID=2645534 RepID=UPI0032B005F8